MQSEGKNERNRKRRDELMIKRRNEITYKIRTKNKHKRK